MKMIEKKLQLTLRVISWFAVCVFLVIIILSNIFKHYISEQLKLIAIIFLLLIGFFYSTIVSFMAIVRDVDIVSNGFQIKSFTVKRRKFIISIFSLLTSILSLICALMVLFFSTKT